MEIGVTLIAHNRVGILHRVTGIISKLGGNITYTQQFIREDGTGLIYMEIENIEDSDTLLNTLRDLEGILEVEIHSTLKKIFGKRIIIIGGGAQVSQVALGAIIEADRHNIRGERISVDTIPIVGEENREILEDDPVEVYLFGNIKGYTSSRGLVSHSL
ncbi:MAG TPA: ACT domain-containing protein [Aquificae bacterium]|nr:ACT domain-containing protein [Aquificota bacterium]